MIIGLLFTQSVFAKGRPRQVRYTTTYEYSHTVRDRSRGVDYDYYEYEACYERPMQKVVEIHDRAQRERGQDMMAIGAIVGIAGLLITGDDRNLGRFVTAVGGLLAVAGAVEFSNSAEIFYEHQGYECESYYQVDSRRYRFKRDGYRCVTSRHYTHRWGGVHEYFVTRCGGKKFVSFKRHRNIWRHP